MDTGSILMGLGSLGFWIFLTSVVTAGIWYDLRKKQSEQQTIRQMLEMGQSLDQKQLEMILNIERKDNTKYKDFRVSGIITLFLAFGLSVFGWVLSFISEKAFIPLLGVGLILLFLSLGLLLASRFLERAEQETKSL